MEKQTFTKAVDETVAITITEYRELIACKTMLDMILTSARKESRDGYPDPSVVKMADAQRRLYLPSKPNLQKNGGGDA